MTPYNAANAPQARELGHEVDLIATYKICPRKSVLFGYSHFFAADYYNTTTLPACADGADADFFCTQFHVNF